jgi:hypothetical protein
MSHSAEPDQPERSSPATPPVEPVPPVPTAPPAPAERSVLDEPAAEDRDEVWGDRGAGARDEDWYRRERPPHHGD